MAAAAVALAAACSSPDPGSAGFISLGRDGDNVGAVGASPGVGGGVPTGGAFPMGGTTGGTFPVGGTAGTAFPVGGTTGVNGGTSTNGGTAGDGNGGTGGDGPSCGSGGMPLVPEPNSGGSALFEACGEAGPNQRICMMDGTAVHCGYSQYPVERCAPGTCETGCCHATSDPCPIGGLTDFGYDCAGGCDAVESCTQAPILNLTINERDIRVVRVGGSNTVGEQCGQGTRRNFELLLDGAPAHLMVSPPWMLAEGFTCADAPDSQCLVSQAGYRFVVVMTDADPPPPRNVVIFAHERETLTCASRY